MRRARIALWGLDALRGLRSSRLPRVRLQSTGQSSGGGSAAPASTAASGCLSTNARPRSAGDSCRPDQQIEDPHLGEVVAPSYELPPGRAQRPAIEVEVAFVAADERERAFSERSAYSEVIVGQVRLDDAVEHGDERGAFG